MTFATLASTSVPITASPMVDHVKQSASSTSMSVHGALSLKRRLSEAVATTTGSSGGGGNNALRPPLKRQRRVSAPYVLAAATVAANASTGGRVRTLATDFAALDALFALDFVTLQSNSYASCNGILAAPPKKRVSFDLKYGAVAAPASLHPLCSDDTWYSAKDYHSFQLDCRRTIVAARQSLLLNTGDFDECHDMTLCGVEQFLSPTLERERQQRVQHHVQSMLAKVKLDKRAPRRLAMQHGSCSS